MDSNKKLLTLAKKGFEQRRDRFTVPVEEYIDRFKREYRLITSLGYADYFLIVHDVVSWAKNNGIKVGPARGSVAGSLLAYLTKITDVDPLRFDLLFSRFMNSVRSKIDPPDIDLDFQASRRDEVKQYIFDRFGEDRVCSIGAHSRAYASGAIKDTAKVLGLDFQKLNKVIAHKLYDKTLEEGYEDVKGFKKWVNTSEKHQRCFEIAKKIEGLIRHRTVHPAGVIITPGKLEEYVPTIKIKGEICSQWKDEYVHQRGLLKLDILGLKALDILGDALEWVEDDIDLLDIPLTDSKVLDLFTNGETLGVFQFETAHLQRIIKELHADSFEDLVAATTIARPGSLDIGVTDSFIRRKHGKEETTFVHEMIEDLLSDTYGFPIYQELVMKMAHIAGNISLAGTERMRDAIKHFKDEKMARYKEKFIQGAQDNGATIDEAQEMWEMIQAASGYTYNKSHAVSYSLISYWMGYLKEYFPKEFITASLKNESKEEKVSSLVAEGRRLGLKFGEINLNTSQTDFSIDEELIRPGFKDIKYVGQKAAEELIKKRPFESKEDLLDKVSKRRCNSRVIDALEGAGAFGDVSLYDKLESYGCYVGELPSLDLDEITNCKRCELHERANQVVAGNGNFHSKIVFIGEAPGYHEDKQGRPFVGRSGRLLRTEWIPELGLRPGDVWITNVVKCLPRNKNGKKKSPSDQEVQICSFWLDLELRTIDPEIVVILGSHALKALSIETSITRMNGKTFEIITPYSGRLDNATGFGLFHPAYVLRKHNDMKPALNNLKELIGGI